jgi:glycosyltransferase involved in cell wall biosynthesis
MVDLLLAQKEGPNLAVLPPTVRIIDFKARRLISSLPALVRYLRRERPAVLLSMMAHTNIVALLACRLAGVSTRKVVSERVSLSWRKQQQSKPLLWLIRHFYPWADEIIAVSDGVADDLSEVAGISRERIRTIYNPIVRPALLEQAKSPLDHPWFKPGQAPVVLAAGRLCEQKDFSTLIRAFAQARRQRPARLLILGEGELRPNLEQLVTELGLDNDVSLSGFSANPYAYMAHASVFVLSSKWEGLPGVLIEALYCGAALIATDCPSGPKEVLNDGQYGQLVPVGDQDKLAEAIMLALDGKIPRPPAESWQPFEQECVVNRYIDVLLAN